MTDPVYIIDGSAYIFRAFYATPRLTNSGGFPTNALYGFTRMLLKLLNEVNPKHVVMVFDAGRETFRNEIYPEYKANRSECPEDLVPQMPFFRSLSKAFGLRTIETPGFEADDVIGTLVEKLNSDGQPAVIVSADKDLMQLVNDDVTMWDTMRGKKYGAKEVEEKLGVLPEKVIEYLAIAGDSSDNIPGLKGAGPKTAVQLICTYGTVENIIASKEQILNDKNIRSRKKISAQIESDEDLIRLSKQLVTVKRDVPLNAFGLEHDTTLMEFLERHEPVSSEVEALVRELEFESLIKEFGLDGAIEPADPVIQNYKLILHKDFDEWLKRFLQQKVFAFDLETTSLSIQEGSIVGIAVCWSEEEAYYIPVGHALVSPGEQGSLLPEPDKDKTQVTLEDFTAATKAHFEDKDIKKVGQNLKFDCQMFLNADVTVRGVWFDTMLAAYLLHPDRGGYGLSALSKKLLSHTMVEFSDIVAEGHTFADVSLEEALHYAAEDAHITWLIYQKLSPLIEEHNLKEVMYDIESPLVEVLSAIEYRGVRIDLPFLQAMSESLGSELSRLEQEIYTASDSEFNINSPKQIGEVLFDKLGLPTTGIKKTTHGYSTNQTTLEKLEAVHPVPALILEYRGLHKLKSTYVDALPQAVSEKTGRLHTKLNQTIAATGRLSSSDPNLQNIPIQTELGRQVRKAFVPKEGCKLLSADYSQIELRLLAHLSEDEALIDSFVSGVDIHDKTAREILGREDAEEITSDERRLGKTINFGIVYGMSGYRLGRDLGIPIGEAQQYIDSYFSRYPKVHKYFDGLEEIVESGGEVRTLWGRRRIVNEIDQGSRDRGFVKRAALNAPLQGSAADLIKLSMIQLRKVIQERSLPLEMILQIHDELLFEVPEAQADEMMAIVKEEMENVVKLSVPLEVQVALGSNWDEAH